MKVERKDPTSVVIIILGIIIGVGGFLILNNSNDKKQMKVVRPPKPSDNMMIKNSNDIKPLDLRKSNNTSDITYDYQKDLVSSTDTLELKINDNKRSITININWDELIKENNKIKNRYVGTKPYQIRGFEKNINSAYIGLLGEDYSGTTLFYLMEDNTVEYTKFYSPKMNIAGETIYDINFSGDHFENHLIVPEIKNVVNLYSVHASSSSNNSYTTVIATMKDGSFYDLGPIINK